MGKSIGYKWIITLAFMVMSFAGVQAQNNGTESNDNSDQKVKQDPFVPKAAKLAQDLQSKINLDDDQMQKIRDRIIQYNSKVRDLQGIQLAALRENSSDQRAGAKSGNNTTTNRTGTSETGPGAGTNDNYGAGSHSGTGSAFNSSDQSDFTQNLRDNDVETNKDIEDVLNDNQKSAWLSEKGNWWSEVKDEVYSGGNSSSDMDSDTSKTGMHKKGKMDHNSGMHNKGMMKDSTKGKK